MKYSITLSSFIDAESSLSKTLKSLKRCGFDSVEIFGEPDKLNVREISGLIKSYSLSVSGITGMWGSISKDGWKRKIITSDPSILKYSQQYVKECLRMCNSLDGGELNLCLFADDEMIDMDMNHNVISQERKAKILTKITPILKKLCLFASDYGVKLLLEPLNRYSTPFCTKVGDAMLVAKEINNDYFRIMLDTFHMNIEEDSFENAILIARNMLEHMHFADNNRSMPGYGHIDFGSIIKSLKSISYTKYISFEPIINDTNYEPILTHSLQFVKRIEKENTVKAS